MEIIKEGVRIDRLFKHFKGNFKGSSCDSPLPPPMRIDNAKVCEQFWDFITDTVVDWVHAGVLAVWGRVGEVTPPPPFGPSPHCGSFQASFMPR